MIRFDDVRAWVFDTALPFWGSVGLDRLGGGFVEHLDLAGRDAHASFKRTRVQARQIYAFAHAALMGWAPGRALAESGWRFLDEHGRDGDGGWMRLMGPHGEPLDTTCDAYDMAFVLFAHAWMHRLTGRPELVAGALGALDTLERRLRHPNGLGFFADDGRRGPRQQNPHMHLLEAALELAETTGEARFKAMATEILVLFRDRIVERETGVLREFFADDWSRLSTNEGRLVEPGHQYEWTWLLYRAEALTGLDMRETARALYGWAEAQGLDPRTALAYDQVRDDGAIVSASSRTWPQTEALKAHLAMFEHEGRDTRIRIAASVSNLLDRYLAAAPAGAWIDQFDADGRPSVDKIPSSTFYHVLLAFSELLRLQPALQRASLGDP